MLQADQYAPETEVHKFLHSRLASFDIATLYELHYQMITLGKVGLSFVKAATPLSCRTISFVFAHFSVFKAPILFFNPKYLFCCGNSKSVTPGESKNMFLSWGHHSFHAYDGRLEYAHVVSIVTHTCTHTEACPGSPPPLGYQYQMYLQVALPYQLLFLVMLLLGLDATCVILLTLIMKQRLCIGQYHSELCCSA